MALFLWFFECVDELMHCFKIAWNMKEKEGDPSLAEYYAEHLDADLESISESLKEGFLWIGKNANKALIRDLKNLYDNNRPLYDYLAILSRTLSEAQNETDRLFTKEAKKRGATVIDARDLASSQFTAHKEEKHPIRTR
jgi:hypothetical protein